jgi:hypothetical protein
MSLIANRRVLAVDPDKKRNSAKLNQDANCSESRHGLVAQITPNGFGNPLIISQGTARVKSAGTWRSQLFVHSEEVIRCAAEQEKRCSRVPAKRHARGASAVPRH